MRYDDPNLPDEVLEQIAHAGDCAIEKGDPRDMDYAFDKRHPAARTALTSATAAPPSGAGGKLWPEWRRAARWAARLLGVEVTK